MTMIMGAVIKMITILSFNDDEYGDYDSEVGGGEYDVVDAEHNK